MLFKRKLQLQSPQSQTQSNTKQQSLPQQINSITPSQDDKQNSQTFDPEQILAEKLAELDKRRQKFIKTATIVGIALLILGIAALSFGKILKLYLSLNPGHQVVVENPEEPVKPIVNPTPEIPTAWGTYVSDLFKLKVKYPENSYLQEKELQGENPQKLEISYEESPAQKQTLAADESALKSGYIFRITLLNLPNRTIDDAVAIKREAYKQNCPATAIVSEKQTITIDNIEGRTFKVLYCDHDLTVTFIPRFGIYYEITQVSAGDIGYKQKYQAVTNEILMTLHFYLTDSEIAIDEPFTTYINNAVGFSFRHPNWDDKCCVLESPVLGQSYTHLKTIADTGGGIDSDKAGKIGFFAYYLNFPAGNFDAFLARQKQLLTDDYKLANGYAPKVSEEVVKIADSDKYAVKLVGYSWRNYDFIFIKVDDRRVIVIEISNKTGDEFTIKFNEILETFKFL